MVANIINANHKYVCTTIILKNKSSFLTTLLCYLKGLMNIRLGDNDAVLMSLFSDLKEFDGIDVCS